MTRIDSIVLESSDAAVDGSSDGSPSARAEMDEGYEAAFGLGDVVQVRRTDAAADGFRGFAISLVVSQPSTVDSLVGSAVAAGASHLKPVEKSFWGYGGTLRTADGAIWKVASSAKKNTGPASRDVDDVVLLLGATDVKASKAFYLSRGFTVAKSFGNKYVEFDMTDSKVKFALYSRRAAAKDVGVAAEGNGSHRIIITGDAGSFTDPDGFVWA